MKYDDYYEFLEIKVESTLKEIASAYRKKAILYHPDKNKTEQAKEIFQKLSKAYEVLSDPKAREAYDIIKKAQIAKILRDSKLSEERKKCKNDLERREYEAEQLKKANFHVSSETVANAKVQLEKEIERLRKEGHQRLKKEIDLIHEELEKFQNKRKLEHDHQINSNQCKVKIKWDYKTMSINESELEKKLSLTYGTVKYLVLSRKGTAIVEFEINKSSENCVNFPMDQFKTCYVYPAAQESLTCSKKSTQSFEDFEALTLLKMKSQNFKSKENIFELPSHRILRQKEERERLISDIIQSEKEHFSE